MIIDRRLGVMRLFILTISFLLLFQNLGWAKGGSSGKSTIGDGSVKTKPASEEEKSAPHLRINMRNSAPAAAAGAAVGATAAQAATNGSRPGSTLVDTEEMEKNRIPATDLEEAEKQAKEISGRDDPFKSLVVEEGALEGFRGVPRSETEGLLLTGVFINGATPTAILQRGSKSYYVTPGMSVENLKVVGVEEDKVNLVSKTGKRYVIKIGGSL